MAMILPAFVTQVQNSMHGDILDLDRQLDRRLFIIWIYNIQSRVERLFLQQMHGEILALLTWASNFEC